MDTPSLDVTVACFGETLWDILPKGIFLGGAPLNVAYHLSRQGVRSLPISAVGRDFLGDEALRRIAAWGLDVRFISRQRTFPTGTVRATLDPTGSATYRITRSVAWDHISAPRALLAHPAPAALVFGTLALREDLNRRTLSDLLTAWPDTLRVLDLNLRAPFDRPKSIALALSHAQWVKLNHEELARMIGHPMRTAHQLEKGARIFSDRHGVSRVCLTAGGKGAGLLWDMNWFWEDGRPTVVRDTVGAGDAFLATLLASLLGRGAKPSQALATACRAGEFVAARDGATPLYSIDARGRPNDRARDYFPAKTDK